jgi:hypothetical protein
VERSRTPLGAADYGRTEGAGARKFLSNKQEFFA